MSYQQFNQGAGATSYNNSSSSSSSNNATSSLLNANPSPVTTVPAPTLPGRQLVNTHPCTWPGCPRFFASPHNVQQHIREKHTHEKPYRCEECAAQNVDTAFARQYGLNRHRAQVHGIGEKPSRVPAKRRTHGSVISAEPAQPEVPLTFPTQAMEIDGEFAEMARLLRIANNEMEVSGGDIEMSDAQVYSDDEQPETTVAAIAVYGAQDSGGYACGDCAYAAATKNEVRMHMHAAHQTPNNLMCGCDTCLMLHASSNNAA